MFPQKLDLLMKLTNSHNVELARAIGMDATAVSRLRSGVRKPQKSLAFLPAMSSFFAHRLTTEHQRMTAADLICPGSQWPERCERAAEYISLWLAQSCEPQESYVEELIGGVSNLVFPMAPDPELENIKSSLPAQSLYYGTGGMKKAFIDLLDAAVASHKAHIFYLFSDECTNWLDSSPEYLLQWVSRLKQLISYGCVIRVIYNTACPESELMHTVTRWLPLYITNSVEPFYFPKIRDGVYRRTLFVAEGIAALQSSSLDGFSENTLCHLVTDRDGVDALYAEICSYHAQCKPLLELLFGGENFQNRILNHDRSSGSYILASVTPSLFTMPLRVAERVSFRSSSDELFKLCKKLRQTDLFKNSSRQLCELVTIPTDEQLAADEIPVGFGALLGLFDCYYTANELSVHLKSMSELAGQRRDYRFELSNKLPHNIVIYCKDDEWAVISKCNMPCYSFIFRQPGIVKAICAYLHGIYDAAQTSSELRARYAQLMKKAN